MPNTASTGLVADTVVEVVAAIVIVDNMAVAITTSSHRTVAVVGHAEAVSTCSDLGRASNIAHVAARDAPWVDSAGRGPELGAVAVVVDTVGFGGSLVVGFGRCSLGCVTGPRSDRGRRRCSWAVVATARPGCIHRRS